MEVLDEVTKSEKSYFKYKWNKRIMIIFSLACLLIQLEAANSVFLFFDYFGLITIGCFGGSYAFRIFLIPPMLFSIILAWQAFNRNGRLFPNESIDKLILASPFVILILDIILTVLIGGEPMLFLAKS